MYIFFPSAHLFNTQLIYSLGLICKRNEKARQESECPTFLQILVISLDLLKFSAYPTEFFKTLDSLSMSEFTMYLSSISCLSLFYVTVGSTIPHQTSSFRKCISMYYSWTWNVFISYTELWPSNELDSSCSIINGWDERGPNLEEMHEVCLEWKLIAAETPWIQRAPRHPP